MNKRSKIEGTDGELELPQPIIQHVQSFLTGKEAAQTTLLSKSWYGAWLTRPDLDFDQHYFQRVRDDDCGKPVITYHGFYEFADNTLQRYDELNRKIESFRLRITWWGPKISGFISKAMELGATDVEVVNRCQYFGTVGILPNEVLGSENLVCLSAEGCKIDLGADGKVKCSKLESLSLCRMSFEGDIVWDIISRCPLIEKLKLSECQCRLEVSTFDIFTKQMLRVLPSSPFNDSRKQNVGSGTITPYEFRKLKYLVLERVRIDTSFFSDFSFKFPCLMELSVCECAGYKEVNISSRSLEYISFVQEKPLRAKFDVPRIGGFCVTTHFLPAVSFENPSKEFMSRVSLSCKRPGTSWFIRLRKFLAKLGMSKIFLSVWFGSFLDKSYDYARDVKGLPKPLLENLKVSVGCYGSMPGLRCAHLDALIWSCRPKFITQNWYPEPTCARAKRELLDLLCRTLVQEESENCYIPNKNMRGLDDLKDVKIYEKSVAKWVALPWKTLLDASAFPEKERELCFQLKWK